jgi:hypothetical protein
MSGKKEEKEINEKKSDTNIEKEGKDNKSTEIKNESPEEGKKQNFIEPQMLIGTPFYFANIPNYCYNKMYNKKQKPFTEREGDWVCQRCRNLNFSFRTECNRCRLPKESATKNINKDEEKKDNNNNKEKKDHQKKENYYNKRKMSSNSYNNKNNKNKEN